MYIDVNHVQRDEKSRLFSLAKKGASAQEEEATASALAAADAKAAAEKAGGQAPSQSAGPLGSQTAPENVVGPDTLGEDQFVALGNLSNEAVRALYNEAVWGMAEMVKGHKF